MESQLQFECVYVPDIDRQVDLLYNLLLHHKTLDETKDQEVHSLDTQ